MITYHAISEVGGREKNEDNVLCFTGNRCFCFAVADGLGGAAHGEEASAFVSNTINNIVAETAYSRWDTEDIIRACQSKLLDKKAEGRMGNTLTTLVLLLIRGDTVQWGHVGDSRLYLFKNGKLKQRTYDHSLPQLLVDAGEISEDDIRIHPDRNKLLKVMGQKWRKDDVDVSEIYQCLPEDSFLLCSDGFWENITEDDMEKCLSNAKDVVSWIEEMKKIVAGLGDKKRLDNYTAIGIWNR